MLKVGRTKKLIKRLDDRDKQCASKEQILRSWWPNRLQSDCASLFRGRVKPSPTSKCSYRLERLIHVELTDLVYLDPIRLHFMAKDSIMQVGYA
jgi:Meiotically up-regulated gene 113